VDLLTREGPELISRLLEMGLQFDRDSSGRLHLGREAAHSRRRIVHAGGDATGAAVVAALGRAVTAAGRIQVLSEAYAIDLILQEGTVCGVMVREADNSWTACLAAAVVLATGGSGAMYRWTTNPPEATGDGLAMAARAGARLVDLEFVQFHPTALACGTNPLPLLTEALRGEGAVLVDDRGDRFMRSEHPDAELAPRDVVARAIWRRLSSGRRVFLDARRAVGDAFPRRFPTVFQMCREHGLDPRTEPLPVTPAAHYHIGGVQVDLHGRSSLPGLWACGETAATGVHGANRLASNSLLEALVFGRRVAQDIKSVWKPRRIKREWGLLPPVGALEGAEPVKSKIRDLMWNRVGLVRDRDGLEEALSMLAVWEAKVTASAQVRNMLLVGRLVAAAALQREESRGVHYRSDFPQTSPDWQRHLVQVLPVSPSSAVAEAQ
jgi:L-aspartate oxidase